MVKTNSRKSVNPGKPRESNLYTNAELASLLHALDLPFVWGDPEQASPVPDDVTHLLIALTCSDDARLRLALIPLFLRHPHFAMHAQNAAAQLSSQSLVVLHCYYTAAYFLQQVHQTRLLALFGSFPPLPDLFSAELNLPKNPTPEEGLRRLAKAQQICSHRAVNWLGTYHHGADQFLRYCEKRKRWHQSPAITSAHS